MDLVNQFLIAMPSLEDPNFLRSVTYICEHNDDGALGLVINHPTNVSLGDMFDQLELVSEDESLNQSPVFHGGPVSPERGFVLHDAASSWEATMPVTSALSLTSSRDILAAIADGAGPDRYLVVLGYAGWTGGQLEQELQENSWLTVDADAGIIFEIPHEERWKAAAAKLGIEDPAQLSSTIGHG